MSIVISFLLTLLIYGIGPLSLAFFRKKPITQNAYRWMCKLAGLCVWIALLVLYICLGIERIPNIMAAIIWTFVFQSLGIERLIKKELFSDTTAATNEPAKVEINDAVADDTKKFVCDNCGTLQTGWYQKCPNCGAVGKMRKL